jgi:hypothetical protein
LSSCYYVQDHAFDTKTQRSAVYLKGGTNGDQFRGSACDTSEKLAEDIELKAGVGEEDGKARKDGSGREGRSLARSD